MIVNENTNIKEWYMEEYPDDEVGATLNDDITFEGLFETLDSYGDVYEYLGGAADSVVRERCFAKLAEIMQVDYSYIYEQWLLSV
jgi:hypothetical protein